MQAFKWSLVFCLIIFNSNVIASHLSTLSVNKWHEFSNSRLDSAFPSVRPAGDPSGIIYAWGSGVYDSDRDQLVVWGGGHGDYAGNEVYAFGPLTSESPKWKLLTNPSIPAGDNTKYAPDGRPVSRHTYNLLDYMPAPFNKMISCAIGAQHSNGYSNAAVDLFDFSVDGFSSEPWSRAASAPSTTYATGGFCAFNPVTQRLWYHDTGSGSSRLQEYNPATNKWTAHVVFDPQSDATPAIDPTRNILVTVGTHEGIRVWDLNNPGQRPITVNSAGSGNLMGRKAPGFIYDPVNDRFVGWNGGATLYALSIPSDFKNGTWQWNIISSDNSVTPTNVAGIDEVGYVTGTYGRFRYAPSLHAVMIVNSAKESVYYLRLEGTPGAQGPDVNFSSSTSLVQLGGSAILTWNASAADTCAASGDWSGSKAISSSQTILSIAAESSFTLSCTNSNGTVSRTVNIGLQSEPTPTPPPSPEPPPPPPSVPSTDTTAPSVPAGLNWASENNTQVDLTWNASSDNNGGSGLLGYKVYRDGALLESVTGTSWSDVVLAAGSDYQYGVSAVDNAGNESALTSVTATTATSGKVIARINAGGGAYIDSFGREWSADTGSNTGNVGSSSNSITGSSEDALFQSQRWDSGGAPELEYSIDADNGDYTVNLYFAEYYSGAFGDGLRTFATNLEGDTVLSELDVYAEVGPNIALVKSVATTVSDGQLNIEFIHGAENTMVSAIEIIQNNVADTAPLVNFSANPASVASNGSTVLIWNSGNANNCVAGGDWSGSKGSSGSETVGPLTVNQRYTLTCTGTGGSLQREIVVQISNTGGGGSGGGDNPDNNLGGVPATPDEVGVGSVHPLFILGWLLIAIFAGIHRHKLAAK